MSSLTTTNAVVGTTTTAAAAAAAAPLSKSQKKRLKQKRAKTRKEAAHQASIQKRNETLDPLNAHDAMKIGLQELGFELREINTAIEDMWNKGLEYGEIGAVVAYLTESREMKEEDSSVHVDGSEKCAEERSAAAVNVTVAQRGKVVPLPTSSASNTNDQEEIDTASTSSITAKESRASPSPSPKAAVEGGHDVPITVPNNSDASTTSKAGTQKTTAQQIGASAATTPSTCGKKQPQPSEAEATQQATQLANKKVETTTTTGTKKAPLSLKAKLDIVANNENLTDAIVALTEWIVKAATPLEVRF